MENNKDLESFIAHSYEMFGYWADVRIDEITKHKHADSDTAEFRALKTLVSTDTGKQVLRNLMVDCGESNLHSTLAYIDGGTGIKPLELMNAHTNLPIAEGTLHEYFSDYCREIKRLNK